MVCPPRVASMSPVVHIFFRGFRKYCPLFLNVVVFVVGINGDGGRRTVGL